MGKPQVYANQDNGQVLTWAHCSSTSACQLKTMPYAYDREPNSCDVRLRQQRATCSGVGSREADGTTGDNGRYSVFVNHLGHGIAQQDHILIKRFNLSLQFDSVNQIDGNWDMFTTQCVQERIWRSWPLLLSDMLRVQNVVVKPRTLPHQLTAYGRTVLSPQKQMGKAGIQNDHGDNQQYVPTSRPLLPP